MDVDLPDGTVDRSLQVDGDDDEELIDDLGHGPTVVEMRIDPDVEALTGSSDLDGAASGSPAGVRFTLRARIPDTASTASRMIPQPPSPRAWKHGYMLERRRASTDRSTGAAPSTR
ncbi:hypothetical protein [Brevibacterium permense]|uniref:hypothetical protein n=1 Tax=Brevibacterium permense TaxID=234834 RepID=UPI00156606DF|nr:hypothetical protein [Brevibacterium permense]